MSRFLYIMRSESVLICWLVCSGPTSKVWISSMSCLICSCSSSFSSAAIFFIPKVRPFKSLMRSLICRLRSCFLRKCIQRKIASNANMIKNTISTERIELTSVSKITYSGTLSSPGFIFSTPISDTKYNVRPMRKEDFELNWMSLK